jgi:hypothetical protein
MVLEPKSIFQRKLDKLTVKRKKNYVDVRRLVSNNGFAPIYPMFLNPKIWDGGTILLFYC